MPTYLLNLGLAYQLSGDVRYGRRVVDLLLAITDANYPYWCCQDLGVGALLYGMGLGFDWSYELMTPDERQQIVSAMWTAEHEAFLFGRTLGYNPTNPYAANLEIGNWMGVTAGGAGLTLLAIRGEPGIPTKTIRPFETYLTRALERTRSYFVHGVDPQGANHEGLTYAYYGLKNSVPFAFAARRDGYEDLIAGTGLPAIARWAAFEQLPGEGQNFIPLNDSQRESLVEFEAIMFAIAPTNGVAQWLWQRTVERKATTTSPSRTSPRPCPPRAPLSRPARRLPAIRTTLLATTPPSTSRRSFTTERQQKPPRSTRPPSARCRCITSSVAWSTRGPALRGPATR